MKFTRPLLLAAAVPTVDGVHARDFGNVQLTPTRFISGRDGGMPEQKLGELGFVRLKTLLDKELS